MTFLDLLIKYQTCDPATGAFTVPRSKADYARLLDVNPVHLTQLYQRKRPISLVTARALIRVFPQAAAEVTAAIERIERERAGLATAVEA